MSVWSPSRPCPRLITQARRAIAAGLAVALMLTLAQAPSLAAPAVSGSPPPATPVTPVATRDVAPVQVSRAAVVDGTKRPVAVWPVGAAEVVVPSAPRGRMFAEDAAGAAKAGGLPVWVGRAGSAPAPSLVRVEALGRAPTAAAGVRGLLLRVGRDDGAGGGSSAQVTVDYGGFRNAYGAGWASRLRLVVLPECVLTPREGVGCGSGQVLPTVNDWRVGSVTAAVPVGSGAGTLVAVMAGTSGPSGDLKATSLAASSTWSAGGNSGDFSWSYPMRVPPAVGGPAPQVGLAYSSQSVDGRQPAENNQPSIVGEGFELAAGGFIDRRYRGCNDDKAGGNNSTLMVGDQCWATDNAVLSLAGHSGELIYNAGEGRWHLRSDDGSRIERRTGGVNGDNDGEHWVVTTTDGTQYWFGLNRLPGWAAGKPETGSVWTAPVFGNHTGEPCHAATFAASWCSQAWRWNLDYVVDTHGNTMSLWYGKDTNKYAKNLATSSPVEYIRGGWLDHIDYGTDQRSLVGGNPVDSVFAGQAPARVAFGYADRCLSDCGTHDGPHWPDTPWDTECTGSSCDTVSPTFWTTRRLSTVTTQVWDAAGSPAAHRGVERWTFSHTFPDPGDSNRPGLWLERISRAGIAGGQNTAVPDIEFTPVTLNNRVDGIDHSSSMNWHRIAGIRTETGATISVTYTGSDCTPTGAKPDPHNNTRRCYPVKWKPEGFTTPVLDWFNKYVVTTIYEADNTGGVAPFGSPRVAYQYSYLGDAAWHYTDDDGLITPEHKTWSVWRGYAEVGVTVGDPGEQTYSTTRYFRGMHGDKQPSGTRTVSVDGINDEDWWAGRAREQITYNGPGGPEVSATVTTPWASAPTASRSIGGDITEARFTNTAVTATRTALDGGRPARTTRVSTTFDSHGMPVQTDDEGDLSVPDDQQCTKIGYEPRNTGAWLLALPHQTQTFAVGCAATADPAALTDADVISHTRTSYDEQAWGTQPGKGNATLTEQAKTWNGGNPGFITVAGAVYDPHGRVTDSWDALNRHSYTAYTPASGGPVTATTVTNALDHVATTYLDPAWGSMSASVDANNKRTDISHDGLGRVTAVWLPGRDKATKTANSIFSYLIRNNAPSVVSTGKLNPTGSAYITAHALLDGSLRARQTQVPSPAAQGGRILTDTFYDTAGRAVRAYGSYYDNRGPAGTALVHPDDPTDVPNQNRTIYDGAGRVTAAIFQPYTLERWRTTTGYGGDRTDLTPPAGGTATSTILDARGRTTQLRQYQAATPTGGHDTTSYTYNRKGQLVTVTDPVGNHWDYTYDLLGRQTRVDDPDKGTTTSTYNDAGQLQTVTDARGRKLIYTYDQLGRRFAMYQTLIGSGTLRAQWTYDTVAKGHLSRSIRRVGTAAYVDEVLQYNDSYQPLLQRIEIAAAETGLAGVYEYSYSYNVDGSPASALIPATGDLPEESLYLDYDDMGLAHKLTSRYNATTTNNSYVTNTRYNALAQVDQLTLYTGQYTQTGSRVWLAPQRELETGRLTGLITERETGPQTTIADLDYSYDHAGNITKISDTVSNDHQCFRQDHLRRLTQAWTPTDGTCTTDPTAAALGGPAPYWLSWTYDTTGNRRTQIDHATAAGDVTTTYTHPAAGTVRPHTLTSTTTTDNTGTRTGSYTYDNAGNTLTRPTATGGTQTLTWDPEGHLASSADTTGTTTYLYDAGGNRLIRRDPTGKTLYLPGQELRYTTATATRTCTRYYTYNGATIASRTTAGLTWLTTDHQGTAQIAIDEATQQATIRRQTPFGTPRGSTPAWPNQKGFVGGTTDNTGLTHLGAREYDPTIGRFISVDPLIDLHDPQHMHGYSYANNNPITLSDPNGLEPGSWCTDSACAIVTAQSQTSHPMEVGSVNGAYKTKSGPKIDPKVYASAYIRHKGYPGKTASPAHPDSYLPDTKDGSDAFHFAEMVYRAAHQSGGLGYIPSRGCYLCPFPKGRSPNAHELLTLVGLIPGLGEPADIVNGGLYAYEGDYGNAAWSFASAAAGFGIVIGLARLGRLSRAACRGNSFVPGTMVLLADGSTKPIENLDVGDVVLATDPETGQTAAKAVAATITGHGNKELVEITIDLDGPTGDATGVLVATDGHPFWVPQLRQWINATDLTAGQWLHTSTGIWVQITALKQSSQPATVHNLTITDIHTYYVLAGNTPVLVHNTGPCIPGMDQPTGLVADKIALHAGQRSIPGVADEDLAAHLEDIMSTPGTTLRSTPSGIPRMGWWDESTGTMVIREGNDGTFMQPSRGYDYFLEQAQE